MFLVIYMDVYLCDEFCNTAIYYITFPDALCNADSYLMLALNDFLALERILD